MSANLAEIIMEITMFGKATKKLKICLFPIKTKNITKNYNDVFK